MLYVGVDAHKATSHITVMDETGQVLKRKRVPSTLPGLYDALGSFRKPMKAVLEATYNWGPVYDWLGEIADDVTLAHPAEVKAIAHARIKTDKIDSATLAHLLRADLIPPAYAPSKETRAIKRVLRQRMFFVRVRTMAKNRIHALLVQHAVPRPEVSDLFGVTGRRWLQSLTLPEPDGTHGIHGPHRLCPAARSTLPWPQSACPALPGTPDLQREDILYGLAILTDDVYPRWLGWVAVIGGVASVLVGLNQAYRGLSDLTTNILYPIVSTVLILWFLVMGVVLWRRAGAAG